MNWKNYVGSKACPQCGTRREYTKYISILTCCHTIYCSECDPFSPRDRREKACSLCGNTRNREKL